MSRPFTNWVGVWLVVAVAKMAILVPAVARADATFLNSWGGLGAENGQFNNVDGVAVGPTGMVYAADDLNNRVEVFSSSGAFQSTFGSAGNGNGQFYTPSDIAVAPSGTIYVGDVHSVSPSSAESIDIFNNSGGFQSTFTTPAPFASEGDSVAVGPTGTVYLTVGIFSGVYALDASGGNQSLLSNLARGGVAVSPNGTIYVDDQFENKVYSLNSFGVLQNVFGSTGSGNGQFSAPGGLAVSPAGMVYVTDVLNHRVEIFNSSGVFQSTFGGSNGSFNNAQGIAVSPAGMIYVADAGNSRIQRFFDPNSWTSGTNTFTDSTVGPTSVIVGPGQMMGTSLTLNSTMGLEVGSTASVYSGGLLTLAGGSLTAPTLVVYSGGSLTYQTGSLSVGEIFLGGGFFQATQGGQLSTPSGVSIAGPGEMLLDGGTSLTTETVSMQDGGLLALGNATVSATSASIPFRIFGGEVQLQNANTSIINTPQLLIQGGDGAALLDGSGRINGQLQIYSGTEASVASGQTMTITGTGNLNNGLMSLTGGTFHFTQGLTNNGAIEGTGTLRVDGGLTNVSGASVTLGGLGPAYVFGAINNSATLSLAGSAGVFGTVINNASGGTIHLSGNTPNIFYSTVTNGGAINIDAGAIGLFYGGVTGSGTITNAGSAQFDATSTAGTISGTGSISLVSAVTLDANSFTQGGLTLQLAGNTVGANSKLDVAGALNLTGKLTVSLVSGFTPALGNSFDLLDWGTLSGTFSSLTLPALSTGLTWNTSQLYTTGVLSVVGAGLPGDYNSNGVVDTADYVVWRANLGTNNVLANDPIGGTIGAAQYNQWRAYFGQTAGSGAGAVANAAVPEPATLVLLTIAASGWCFRRGQAA